MRPLTVVFVLTQAVIGWSTPATSQSQPPKRAEVPFRVFVTANPEDATEDEHEQIEEAREELAKRVGKNKKWFRLASTEEEAEIVVDLLNYWTRQEKRVLTTWGVVPPTEAGQPDTTQMIEVVTYHYLQARVELFGAARTLRGERVRKHGGEAKDAVKDLVRRLEELCQDEYHYLMERRARHSHQAR